MNNATNNSWKIDRQAAIANCSVYELALAVESYKHLRQIEKKSPKRAHTKTAARHGWDMATMAQELVDRLGV